MSINRNVEAAAKRLREAAAKGLVCEPVRNLIGTTDIEKAYAVQEINTALRVAQGARIIGSKIGFNLCCGTKTIGCWPTRLWDVVER